MAELSEQSWDGITSFLANSQANWTVAADMDCQTAQLFADIALEAHMPASAADWLDSHRTGHDGGRCELDKPTSQFSDIDRARGA
ncbi:hypothetical protein ACQP1G_20760 [Nocardia sp. CA-107356]|uniref:hypothetical protein n=1 Tax=Nocardia sp. CA-107356 TaxID=3239972 RepID=UPI003D89D89F